jgi:ProP effector
MPNLNRPILKLKKQPTGSTQPSAKSSQKVPQAVKPPKEPSTAKAQAQRKERLIAVIKQLEERWPQAFPKHKADIKPWSLDIHLEIHQANPRLPKRTIQHALKLWQGRYQKVYLKKLAKGGPRYDLQGNPKGEITEREREEAKRQLADTGPTKPRKHTAGASHPPPQEVTPH